MTDILRFGEAPGYEKSRDGIWIDIVGRKAYVTGGMGTGQYGDEGFGEGNFKALFESLERDQIRRGVLNVAEATA
jgi:DUF1680 family protein